VNFRSVFGRNAWKRANAAHSKIVFAARVERGERRSDGTRFRGLFRLFRRFREFERLLTDFETFEPTVNGLFALTRFAPHRKRRNTETFERQVHGSFAELRTKRAIVGTMTVDATLIATNNVVLTIKPTVGRKSRALSIPGYVT